MSLLIGIQHNWLNKSYIINIIRSGYTGEDLRSHILCTCTLYHVSASTYTPAETHLDITSRACSDVFSHTQTHTFVTDAWTGGDIQVTHCNDFPVTFPHCGRLNILLEGPSWRKQRRLYDGTTCSQSWMNTNAHRRSFLLHDCLSYTWVCVCVDVGRWMCMFVLVLKGQQKHVKGNWQMDDGWSELVTIQATSQTSTPRIFYSLRMESEASLSFPDLNEANWGLPTTPLRSHHTIRGETSTET